MRANEYNRFSLIDLFYISLASPANLKQREMINFCEVRILENTVNGGNFFVLEIPFGIQSLLALLS